MKYQTELVQTFWSGGRNLLEYGYGWIYPEYHWASWALSCMSISEQMGGTTLYTDSAGASILVDYLKLPFKEVKIVYDGFNCLLNHWAYAKVKTYSLQEKPFVHIDSDIYLPQPLKRAFVERKLLAQNREYGSAFYREIVERLLCNEGLRMKDYFKEGICKESMVSYNMGLFGGSDLEFIGRFCDEVFRFFKDNRLNDARSRYSGVNANVVFEQMFFAIMSDREERKVECLINSNMRDNGYTRGDVCDLWHYDTRSYFHILGGHKGYKVLNEMVEYTLLRKYPEVAWKVMELFPHLHPRMKRCEIMPLCVGKSVDLKEYDAFLMSTSKLWQDLDPQQLMKQELDAIHFVDYEAETEDVQKQYSFTKNQYLRLFSVPKEWSTEETLKLRELLKVNEGLSRFDVAVIPSMGSTGMKCVAISALAYNILVTLDESMNLESLSEQLLPCFNKEMQNDGAAILKYVKTELLFLLYYGLVTAHKTS